MRVALELDDLFGDQSVCVHKAYTQAAVKSVALRASAVRKAPPHRPRPRSRSRGLSASTRPRQTTTCTPSPLSKNTCVHSLATPSFPGGQWEKKVLCQNRAARLENIYSREALGVSRAVARGCEMLRVVCTVHAMAPAIFGGRGIRHTGRQGVVSCQPCCPRSPGSRSHRSCGRCWVQRLQAPHSNPPGGHQDDSQSDCCV